MFSITTFLPKSPPDGDILSAYRHRIWSLFGVVCIGVFLPGSIFVFITGYRLLAVAVLIMLGMFALNRIPAIHSWAPRLSMTGFVGSLMLVIGLSIMQRNLFGVFWTFPAVLLINFLAYGRLARIYSAIFLVYIGAVMIWVLDPAIAVRALTGLVVTIVLINIFLGVIDKLQAELFEQSSLDPLTGALNRRSMDAIMSEAIERKRRTLTPASLLILDVDEFKSVNDTFGHAVGDRALKELVSTIRGRARTLDKLFRLGGEEFILFLPDTDGMGAATLAEELRRTVSEADLIDGRVITISLGVSELEHGESIDQWIKRADDALFEAKTHGRNRAILSTSPVDTLPPMAMPPTNLTPAPDLRYSPGRPRRF